ncbi:hypothetical protein GGQ87_000057 [Brevundimonas alba]|uniref:Uncharacterized protein n=1 Tax=Brevundimonas alba TaxID=74314 RepID=A0A7X6BMA8_9CAUL|nr:hypothetical protein [Brevundimonas alba]NJC39799.1 hypothetical protein [Brevundimonas alba]
MTGEGSPLAPGLRSFVESAFPSVWALETFLALKRDPEAVWSVDGLVRELRASTALVGDCLERLDRAGLIVSVEGGHRYGPASAALSALADDLQSTYAERPFTVTSVITSRRPDPLKGFADSFRLGGWKP